MTGDHIDLLMNVFAQYAWIMILLVGIYGSAAVFRTLRSGRSYGGPPRHTEDSNRRQMRERAERQRQEERESARHIYATAAAEHDRVRDEYGTWLGNPVATLEKPSLQDVTVPETAAFIEALAVAGDTRPDPDTDDLVLARRWRADVDRASAAWTTATERASRGSPRQEGRSKGLLRWWSGRRLRTRSLRATGEP